MHTTLRLRSLCRKEVGECCQSPVLPVVVSMPMLQCCGCDGKWNQWKIGLTLILLFAGIVKPLCFMAANGLKDMLDPVNSYSSLWSNDILSILHLYGGNKIALHSFMLS